MWVRGGVRASIAGNSAGFVAECWVHASMHEQRLLHLTGRTWAQGCRHLRTVPGGCKLGQGIGGTLPAARPGCAGARPDPVFWLPRRRRVFAVPPRVPAAMRSVVSVCKDSVSPRASASGQPGKKPRPARLSNQRSSLRDRGQPWSGCRPGRKAAVGSIPSWASSLNRL